ncbi:c-type lectin BiL-like protein [Aphelenchoides avenae]|nr:c-type lectin BiL-like protein [Aphelenchus avenae]
MTFYAALATCQKSNATLASIHDTDTNNWIADFSAAHLLTEGTDGNSVWLGLYDPMQTQNWEWTDGTPFDFANWTPGQPDDVDGKEHCVAMLTDLGTSPWYAPRIRKWDDYPCEITFRTAICQLNANA